MSVYFSLFFSDRTLLSTLYVLKNHVETIATHYSKTVHPLKKEFSKIAKIADHFVNFCLLNRQTALVIRITQLLCTVAVFTVYTYLWESRGSVQSMGPWQVDIPLGSVPQEKVNEVAAMDYEDSGVNQAVLEAKPMPLLTLTRPPVSPMEEGWYLFLQARVKVSMVGG